MIHTAPSHPATTPLDDHAANRAARQRMLDFTHKPGFRCDWMRVVFVHFAVDVEVLQRLVPFQLDPFEGEAHVSAVAFTLDRMRVSVAGQLLAWPTAPVARHAYLNLRTYVTHDGQPGIFFLREWVSSRVASWVGPRTYGLPLHTGCFDYRHAAAAHLADDDRQFHQPLHLAGRVHAAAELSHMFAYRAQVDPLSPRVSRPDDSLAGHLLEKYAAFTKRGDVSRRFDVWHRPWKVQTIDPVIQEDSLLRDTGDWVEHARCIGGHVSAGVHDVWMTGPQCIRGRYTWPGEG